jgi:hypothetical protein
MDSTLCHSRRRGKGKRGSKKRRPLIVRGRRFRREAPAEQGIRRAPGLSSAGRGGEKALQGARLRQNGIALYFFIGRDGKNLCRFRIKIASILSGIGIAPARDSPNKTEHFIWNPNEGLSGAKKSKRSEKEVISYSR